MCGIFGAQIPNLDPQPFFEFMGHRGPDSSGFLVKEKWSLGHLRLSIVDLDKRAAQPFEKGNSAIVFNGEIYNHKALKQRFFSEDEFTTTSDTELAISMLNLLGESALQHFNGMFAIGWLDKFGDMWLFRDRFGVKPLYYMQKGSTFYFSSEIKPLLDLSDEKTLDAEALRSFLEDRASDYGEKSGFDGIAAVEAGHWLRIGVDGQIEKSKWYRGIDRSTPAAASEEAVLERAEALLSDSLRLRAQADVPVCISLSGGLDSSTLYVLAKKLGLEVHPFVFMKTNDRQDEANLAVALARQFGDEPTVIQQQESKPEDLKRVMGALEFPSWNLSPLGYDTFYKAIAEAGYRVVIEGHGSDELLGGYPYMVEARVAELLYAANIRTAFDIAWAATGPRTGPMGLTGQSRAFVSFAKTFLRSALLGPQDFEGVLKNAFEYKILPIVLRVFDRITMAHSLESRMPFLDYRFVEFASALESHWKVSSVGSKTLLRKILVRNDAGEVARRQRKEGFRANIDRITAMPKFQHEVALIGRSAPDIVRQWAQEESRWNKSRRRREEAVLIEAMFGSVASQLVPKPLV